MSGFPSAGGRATGTRILLAVAVALLLGLAGAGPAPAGTLVADSGFRPDPNGFSFENYGDAEGYENLNSAEMRKMFGNAVCIGGSAKKCVLSPAARSFMDEVNTAMGGGHCYGFATLATLINRGYLPRFGFNSIADFGGGPDPFDLRIGKNVRLQRSIARAFTAQAFPSVAAGMVIGAPSGVIDQLVADLGRGGAQLWNLSIYQWGLKSGHAITPYAVEDMGGGKYDIHVYDNNFPGDSTRRVHVDTVAETWSYYATTEPGIPEALYRGNAKSQSLRLKPILPGLGIQPCDYCAGRQGANSKHNQITLSATGNEHASLLITDRKGRKTGFEDGRLVNQIPGATVVPRESGGVNLSSDGTVESIRDSLEPVYLIPKHLDLKIKIDGRRMSYEDQEDLNVVGPTFDATLESVTVGPGKVAHATLSPKRQTLSATGPEGGPSPTVTFGAQAGRREAYRINVYTPGTSRKTFFFAKKPKFGLLRIGSRSTEPQRYMVKISSFSAAGREAFGRAYSLRGRQQGYLYYAPLAKPGGTARIAIGEPGRKKVRILRLRHIAPPG